MSYVMPTADATEKLLGIMYGEELSCVDSDGIDFGESHVATFVNPDGQLVAIGACDLPFVVFSGAALSMIPAGTAKDMVKEKEVTDMVQANFYEVMNICSKLMMSDNSSHLKLVDVLKPGESAEQLNQLQEAGKSVDLEIELPGYGKGKMGFLVA